MARRMVSSAFLSISEAETEAEPAIGVVDDGFLLFASVIVGGFFVGSLVVVFFFFYGNHAREIGGFKTG